MELTSDVEAIGVFCLEMTAILHLCRYEATSAPVRALVGI
jgi:hypothetical protein